MAGQSDPGRPADEVRAAGPDQASHGRKRAQRRELELASDPISQSRPHACSAAVPWALAGGWLPRKLLSPCALWLLSERSAEVERRPRAAAAAPGRSRHEARERWRVVHARRTVATGHGASARGAVGTRPAGRRGPGQDAVTGSGKSSSRVSVLCSCRGLRLRDHSKWS